MRALQGLPHGYDILLGRAADCAHLPAIELAAAEMFRPLNVLPERAEPDVVPLGYLEEQCRKGWLWVAAFNGAPIGFVVADIRNGDFYIAELDVHPDHGRKGLGRGLMAKICADAFAKGVQRVTLCTFREVPWNAPFYASLGFTEITRANWTPWMHDLAQRQIDGGIDMETRVYMELAKA